MAGKNRCNIATVLLKDEGSKGDREHGNESGMRWDEFRLDRSTRDGAAAMRGGMQGGHRAQGVCGANSSTARLRSYELGTGQTTTGEPFHRSFSSTMLAKNRDGWESRLALPGPVETIHAPRCTYELRCKRVNLCIHTHTHTNISLYLEISLYNSPRKIFLSFEDDQV